MVIDLNKCCEENLQVFLDTLDGSDDEIIIDFSRQPFLIPAGILALLIKIREWVGYKKRVMVRNHSKFRYLVRMDFFKMCGLEIPEDFIRHDGARRFIPITLIKSNVDNLSTNVALCLIPEQADGDNPEATGMFDYVCYSISELANNVIQHSRGDGYCFAQRYNDYVRIAIADTGIGIRESLVGTPYEKEDDIDAIDEALKVNVSGRAYQFAFDSANAGVGLSLLAEVARLSGGHFAVASGGGLIKDNQRFNLRYPLKGTLCGFCFPCRALERKSFNLSLLYQAKKNLGLISDNNFGDMFI